MKSVRVLFLFAVLSTALAFAPAAQSGQAAQSLNCQGDNIILLQCQLSGVLAAVEQSAAFQGAQQTVLSQLLPDAEFSDVTVVQEPRCARPTIRLDNGSVIVRSTCSVSYRHGTEATLIHDRIRITLHAEVRDQFETYYPVLRRIELRPL